METDKQASERAFLSHLCFRAHAITIILSLALHYIVLSLPNRPRTALRRDRSVPPHPIPNQQQEAGINRSSIPSTNMLFAR
ncbi:hypothetical protein FOXYSP1_20255 [Fusarium oxysporum f. sp. phaseoli]